ncbi:hypothetical protein C8R47DRAFT_1151761 [Mycena vitilis]|nr:hypothetical protein C8R47DRAFT_1151761 [Mycena vitilis]
MSSKFAIEEDASLHKAKQKFLEHLETVDTSEGLSNTLVVKFRLDPEVEEALEAFVTEHGCSMESRVLTREEQDKIDKRQKNPAQHTWFLVTPEAQEAYLKKNKIQPKTPSAKKSPAKTPKTTPAKTPARTPAKTYAKSATKKSTPKTATPASRKVPRKAITKTEKITPESEDEDAEEDEDEEESAGEDDMIKIPLRKFDDMCSRLASALLLLPTTDITRGKECRDALLEVAHDMRQLVARPTKRRLTDDDDEAAGSSRSPANAKKRRVD